MSSSASRFHTSVAAAIVVFMAGVPAVVANMIEPELTIADGSSEVNIDLDQGYGMYSWELGGKDHLEAQWFWYRVGDMEKEERVDTGTLSIEQKGTTDTDFDGIDDAAYVRYGTAGGAYDFTIEITFILDAGADGKMADIGEQINITNNGAEALQFHFYQYCDFDLNGTTDDTKAEITNGNTASQYDGNVFMAETVETPKPGAYEVAYFDATLQSLTDGGETTLGGQNLLEDGNLTWAFQWDFELVPGGGFLISKDKRLQVPEPAALGLVLLGGGMVALKRRRRRLA